MGHIIEVLTSLQANLCLQIDEQYANHDNTVRIRWIEIVKCMSRISPYQFQYGQQ